MKGEGQENEGIAADIRQKQAFKDVIIEMVMVLKYRNGCKHSLQIMFLKHAIIERGRA